MVDINRHAGADQIGLDEVNLASISDKSIELSDNVRNGIAQMHQHWNNRLKCEKFNIAKEYVDGRIAIMIEFNGKSGSDFQYSGGAIWPQPYGAICISSEHAPIWAYNLDVPKFGHADYGRYDGVLLSIVEKMQTIEQFPPTSAICCNTDEKFLRIAARRFYSVTRGFVVPLIASGGETCPSILCTCVETNQFPSGMIEGDAAVMDRVREDEAKMGGYLFTEANLDGNATIRIGAHRKCVGVALHKGSESGLKISDVMLGPL